MRWILPSRDVQCYCDRCSQSIAQCNRVHSSNSNDPYPDWNVPPASIWRTRVKRSYRTHKKHSPIHMWWIKGRIMAGRWLYPHNYRRMQSMPFVNVPVAVPNVIERHEYREMLHPIKSGSFINWLLIINGFLAVCLITITSKTPSMMRTANSVLRLCLAANGVNNVKMAVVPIPIPNIYKYTIQNAFLFEFFEFFEYSNIRIFLMS